MARVDLGGGLFFDPEKVQSAINELYSVLDMMRTDIVTSETLLHVKAPGTDPLTGAFHSPMQAANQADHQALLKLQEKTKNDITNLEAAMKHYLGAEEAAKYALTAQKG